MIFKWIITVIYENQISTTFCVGDPRTMLYVLLLKQRIIMYWFLIGHTNAQLWEYIDLHDSDLGICSNHTILIHHMILILLSHFLLDHSFLEIWCKY